MRAAQRRTGLTALAAVAAVSAVVVPVSTAGAPTTVTTKKVAKLGTILTNAQGFTLYEFTKGTACTGSCASVWKPLLGGAAVGKNGAKQSLISLTTIAGGNKQVTYNKHALYTYTGDTAAGQTKGQGVQSFGGTWYAMSPSGTQASSSGCGVVCGHY